jgi:hypothetical protein
MRACKDAEPMTERRGFASDNHAGMLPEVLAAIAAANEGHAPSYGADAWTARAGAVPRALRPRRARVPRVQRHHRQRALRRGPHPAVGGRRLRAPDHST